MSSQITLAAGMYHPRSFIQTLGLVRALLRGKGIHVTVMPSVPTSHGGVMLSLTPGDRGGGQFVVTVAATSAQPQRTEGR